jgi:L-2,4-diaminobutyric acid acetyltransferase
MASVERRAENRSRVAFRVPTPADGHVVWKMVNSDKNLDTNSAHYYVTWFRDFAYTSVVATVAEEIVGFLTGYRRPEQPDTYFVWQTATKPGHGIPDLGPTIFDHAAKRQVRTGARFIETTVTVDDEPTVMNLKTFADARSTQIEHHILFPSNAFPGDHHDEVLYRIGPLTDSW